MVKKIIFLTLVLIVTCSAAVYSAPCYGTHVPEKKHWTWGVEGDFVIDRNLENDQGGVSSNRYFLTGSLGIFDWLCFDGKIGVGSVRWDNLSAGKMNFDTNFAGAYGFRVKAYENKELGIKGVIGFQHISVHPRSETSGSGQYKVIIDDWQGSVLASKAMGRFVPYLGTRYGSVDFIKWVNEHDRKRIKSEKKVGLVIGMDYLIAKCTRLNIEGDFIDGEKLSIGIKRDF